MKHTYLYILTALLTVLPLSAQTHDSGVLVKDVKVYRNGSNVDVSFVFDLANLNLKSNKSITYTPFITSGGGQD